MSQPIQPVIKNGAYYLALASKIKKDRAAENAKDPDKAERTANIIAVTGSVLSVITLVTLIALRTK